MYFFNSHQKAGKIKILEKMRDKTEWHKVVIFNEGLVRIAEQYLKKGS